MQPAKSISFNTTIEKRKQYQHDTISSFLFRVLLTLEPYLQPPTKQAELLELNQTETQSKTREYLLYYDNRLRTSIFSTYGHKDIPIESNQRADTSPLKLSQDFEHLVTDRENRNKRGVVYTPPQVARFMLERLEIKENQRILDPSTGSGIFLIIQAELLFQKHKAKLLSKRITLLEDCLFGIDLTPLSTEITRVLLILTILNDSILDCDLPSQTLRKNLRTGNGILEKKHDSLAHYYGFSYPEAFGREVFDKIIGNPPYGLSRNEQISINENKLYKQIYKTFLNGKPNKYYLFLAKGITQLDCNGELIFIIPNSWLGIKSGKALRETLLNKNIITAIISFEEPVFKDASVEAVIVQIKKGKTKKNIEIERRKNVQQKINSYHIPVQKCLSLHDNVIPINWDEEISEYFDIIFHESHSLFSDESPFKPKIALQAYALGKGMPPQTKESVKNHIFHSKEKFNDETIPYLEGKDITRYKTNWSGNYLHYGPWLAEHQPIERYTRPRIAIREILGKSLCLLQSQFLEKTYCYNKSMLHIHHKNNDRRELLTLLSILNSQIGSFYIQYMGKKSARKLFPKIVLDDLKNFPISKNYLQFSEELAIQAELQIKEYSHDRNMLIDKIVAELYELPYKFIKKTL